MARRKCSPLAWDQDSDDDTPVPQPVRIQHTETSLGDSGGQSTWSSYLSGSASPPKKTTHSTTSTRQDFYHEGFLDHPAGDTEYLPNSAPAIATDDECDDDLDPAYEHHLADLNSDETKVKRPRVSHLHNS